MSKRFTDNAAALKAEGAYALLARARALEAQGRNIVHLQMGQPDFPTVPQAAQAGIQAIMAGRTNYTLPVGLLELRKAIADVAGRARGLTVSPDEVVVGPGAKPTMFFPTMAVVGPGDEVIVPDPGFPSYRNMVVAFGATPVPVRFRDMRALDIDELEERITPRTRLIIINSPSNPIGNVLPMENLERIAAAARRVDAWVLSDEIYSQLSYEGEAPSIATIPGMRERTIIADGFSKTYCMHGWRLGFAIMPPDLAERVGLLLTHSVGCTCEFTQVAGIAALYGDQSPVQAMRDEYRRRRDWLVRALNELPGWRCDTPKGAFYCFPDVRALGRSSREISDFLLQEAGVAVLPGTDFGEAGEGYLRFSYSTSWENIAEGVRRIAEAMPRLKDYRP